VAQQYGSSIELPQKVKLELPYDPAIPLLSIDSQEPKERA
jgi:hypothetical protein